MVNLSYQVKNPPIMGTKHTMSTPWHDIVPEHQGKKLALFKYGFRFKYT